MFIVILIFGFITVLLFLIYYMVFRKVFIRGPFPRFGSKSLLADNHSQHWDKLKYIGKTWREKQNIKTVETVSHDGLRLVGSLYENKINKGIFILFHGYRSNPIRDFDCIIKKYFELGYSLLVPDQRAHGRSEGKYITFGILERYDCKAWIEYAKKCYGREFPIYLDGLSMGASTVLMASGLDLDANIRGIIADCAFTSPRDIIEKVGCEDLGLPKILFMPQMKLFCKLFAKFDIDATTTTRSLIHNSAPILFIHGTADELVPYEMASRHYGTGSFDKELVTVEGATHGFSYIVDTELVESKLLDFIKKTENI